MIIGYGNVDFVISMSCNGKFSRCGYVIGMLCVEVKLYIVVYCVMCLVLSGIFWCISVWCGSGLLCLFLCCDSSVC